MHEMTLTTWMVIIIIISLCMYVFVVMQDDAASIMIIIILCIAMDFRNNLRFMKVPKKVTITFYVRRDICAFPTLVKNK